MLASFLQFLQGFYTQKLKKQSLLEEKSRQHLLNRERLALLGEMMAGTVHEINNSITTILGFSELLGSASNMEEVKKYTATIQLEAQRCRKVASGLLRFSHKIEKPLKCECSVSELLGNIFDLKSPAMKIQGIRVELNLDDNLPPLFCEPTEIQQVFLNLIQNAEYAMRGQSPPKVLEISCRRAGDKVLIIFRDSGGGVPPALRERIFENFFTTKPSGEGTGLGLGICRDIVARHNGSVNLLKDARSGACFVVELPCTAQPQREGLAGIQEIPGKKNVLAGLKVVVVDDEKPIARFCQTALSKKDCQVETFFTIDEALQYLNSNDFDILIMDYRMGRGKSSGIIFDYLVTQKPQFLSRVILMSGVTYDPWLNERIKQMGSCFLPKPFGVEEMVAAIEKILLKDDSGQGERGSVRSTG